MKFEKLQKPRVNKTITDEEFINRKNNIFKLNYEKNTIRNLDINEFLLKCARNRIYIQ